MWPFVVVFSCVKLQQLEVTHQNLEAVVLVIPVEPGDKSTGTPTLMAQMTHFTYGMSESEWIHSELFLAWMMNLLEYIVSQRPVVLLIDGNNTHIIINPRRENKIILFSLSLHTTYALQPL